MKSNQTGQRRRFHHHLFSVLILSLLLTGCYDNEDIDQRMLISQIGVDAKPERKMQITLRAPLVELTGHASKSAPGSRNHIILSATAKGIYPALLKMQSQSNHSLFIGQCRAVVFGEALAKRGLSQALDLFDRSHSFPNAYIAIARPTAAAIVKIEWPEQESQRQQIRSFFASRGNRRFGAKKWMLFRSLNDPLQYPVLPILTPNNENTAMELSGLAVFRGDRMVGELDTEETRLFGLLRHPQMENRLVVPMGRQAPTTFEVIKGKKGVKSTYPGHPHFQVELRLKAFIGELGNYTKVVKERDIEDLESQSARYIQARLEALLRKLQVMKSDPLELGNYFRVQQPKYFSLAKWREEYGRAEFQVTVKVFIERIGVLK